MRWLDCMLLILINHEYIIEIFKLYDEEVGLDVLKVTKIFFMNLIKYVVACYDFGAK